MRPKFVHCADECIHFTRPVNRRRRETQSLCSAWNSREIDRLNVNPELVEKHIAELFRVHRIANDDRHDMASVIDDRQAQTFQAKLQNLGLLMRSFSLS